MLKDKHLEKFWKPFHQNAHTQWENYLVNLKESKYKDFLLKIGKKIPRKCIITQKFKLSFTFCKLNPFYEHLMVWSHWAYAAEEYDKLEELLGKQITESLNEIEKGNQGILFYYLDEDERYAS